MFYLDYNLNGKTTDSISYLIALLMPNKKDTGDACELGVERFWHVSILFTGFETS